MKYRVRLDLSFSDPADAQSLMDFANSLAGKASSINEDKDNAEISTVSAEICHHDEGGACEPMGRVNVLKGIAVIAVPLKTMVEPIVIKK